MVQASSFKSGVGVKELGTILGVDVWQQIKNGIISKNQDNKPLLMWLEPTSLLSVDSLEGSQFFKLSVPTELHKYWISNNLLEVITSEISAICKNPFQVELIVTGSATAPSNDEFDRMNLNTAPQDDFSSSVKITKSTPSKDTLNSELTFSTFVVGRNNEFAHAVSYSIAENPGTENYNPLFICGPTGMGKTHLLNAVGNYVKQKFPHLTICYCSAERFLNECISAIRRNEMHKFRMRYREQCQILLMDDIQVLGRGEAVQEEFFHTLNHFFEKGQQVIVASDRMPKDILGLEDRIRTRLEWGLIADIQMPDIETRVAILRYKAERKSLSLPQDVVSYVARISKRSIRELEGNLNKIKMFSELQAKPISLELARKVLATHDDTKNITMDEIQKLVADHYKVRIVDLKAKSRTQPLVTARQVAMYMVKKHLDKSLVEIGRTFGGRDHTTVLNAMHRIESQLVENSDLKRDIDEIETRIHNITGV